MFLNKQFLFLAFITWAFNLDEFPHSTVFVSVICCKHTDFVQSEGLVVPPFHTLLLIETLPCSSRQPSLLQNPIFFNLYLLIYLLL